MTEQDLDRRLRTRLERLAGAVPVTEREAIGPERIVRGPVVWARALPSQLAVAVVLVATVAIAIWAGGIGRQPGPAASPTHTTAADEAPIDVASDGTFELALSASGARYPGSEPIDVSAALTYRGPLASIEVFHAQGARSGPIGFGVVEPVLGDLQLTPGWRESCERSTLDAGSPSVVAFQKSGGYSSDHPQSDAYRAYFEDPELRLTPGTWHVYAVADFWLGSCGGEHHELRAEITIVVDEPAATATPTPVPTRPPSGVALPYPEGCVVYGLSERRCAFIVDEARLQLPPGSGDVEKVELLGDPDCPENTSTCYVVRTMAFVVRIRLTTAGGVETDYPIFCGVGGQYSYACTETPEIGVPSLGNSGYWDTPCSGEAPVGCASPLPSIDPGAAADAVPLEIGALDIPIDHAGDLRIPLGTATLPNGQLSEASLRISGTSGWFLVEGGLRLNVTSLDPSRPPFENVHIHGWYPGVEEVSVALEFTILQADAGAVLSVADIVVR